MIRTPRHAEIGAGVVATLLLTACSGSTPAAVPPSRATHSPTVAAISAGPPAASPSAGLNSCPALQPLTGLAVLARTDIGPDDLLALPDGTLWVSDPDSGHVEHLDSTGQLLARFSDPQAPEGMVAVGDTILLAEQLGNRLVRFTPPATTRTTVVTLPARGSAAGLDGIATATGGRLLIPDSPHGTLHTSNPDGSGLRTLASGLGRDVDAVSAPDGAVYVAVEGTRGLLRVPAQGGTATPVGGADVTQLDDLTVVGSLIYATSLATNDVMAIDPATGADRVLVTAGHSLQGLALLAGGRIAVANSTSHLIAIFSPC